MSVFPKVWFLFLHEMYSLNHFGPLPCAVLCILNDDSRAWLSPKNNVLISECWRQATGVLKLHLTRACQASQAVIFLASSLSLGLPDCPLEAFTIDSCFLSVMLFLGGRGACTDSSNEGNVQSSHKDVCGAGRKHQGCLNDLFNLPFLLVYLLHAPFPWELCSDMLVFGLSGWYFIESWFQGKGRWEEGKDCTFSLRHQDRRKKKRKHLKCYKWPNNLIILNLNAFTRMFTYMCMLWCISVSIVTLVHRGHIYSG